jgi:protein-S-isoprenylcysteine O-methyltransferase Ste14
MGLLLHLVFPLHILPTILARGIGVVCVLVSLPLALATLRALARAHTPVDPMKPTTALVTTSLLCSVLWREREVRL